MVKAKIISFVLLLFFLAVLVSLNLMIAGKNQFIMRFVDYRIGTEYRLLAPTFAWLWGTLLTILVSCWIVRIRTINWMCKYELERMDTIVAVKLTEKNNKIKELLRKVQALEKQKQELLKANQSACTIITQALNTLTNSGKTRIYPIKKESA